MKELEAYPISNLPKSWQDAVRFMGCGKARDAVLVYAQKEDAHKWHSGRGYYVYCGEYPEEGAQFLGKRKPK